MADRLFFAGPGPDVDWPFHGPQFDATETVFPCPECGAVAARGRTHAHRNEITSTYGYRVCFGLVRTREKS